MSKKSCPFLCIWTRLLGHSVFRSIGVGCAIFAGGTALTYFTLNSEVRTDGQGGSSKQLRFYKLIFYLFILIYIYIVASSPNLVKSMM